MKTRRADDRRLWRMDAKMAHLVWALRYRVPTLRTASNADIVELILALRRMLGKDAAFGAFGDLISAAEAARLLDRPEVVLRAVRKPCDKRLLPGATLSPRGNLTPVRFGESVLFRASEVAAYKAKLDGLLASKRTQREIERSLAIAEIGRRGGVVPEDTVVSVNRVAAYLGVNRKVVLEARKLGLIRPVVVHQFGDHYLRSDVDALRQRMDAEGLRKRKMADNRVEAEQHLRLIRDKVRAAAAKRVASARALAKGSLLPFGAVPIVSALKRAGLSLRQFNRSRAGLSGKPIPFFHKAPSGRLYCLPLELAAFLANPASNGIVVPANMEARRAKKSRERATDAGRERNKRQKRKQRQAKRLPLSPMQACA